MFVCLREEIERVEKLNEERRKPTSTVSLADLSKHYQEVSLRNLSKQ